MDLIPALKCRNGDHMFINFYSIDVIPKDREKWMKDNPNIFLHNRDTGEYVKIGTIMKIFDLSLDYGDDHRIVVKPKKSVKYYELENVDLIIANHTNGNSHVGDAVVMKDETVHATMPFKICRHEFQELVEQKLEEGWKVYKTKKYDENVKRAVEIVRLRKKLSMLQLDMDYKLQFLEDMRAGIKQVEEVEIPDLSLKIQEVIKNLDEI